MKSQAKCYPELRDYIESVPIVDCHDHSGEDRLTYSDAIVALTSGYFHDDIASASSEAERMMLEDVSIPVEERWPTFERAWKRTKYTGYGLVTRMVMKKFYGEEELTLPALRRIQEKLLDFSDDAFSESVLDKAGIVVRIVDNWPDVKKIVAGSFIMPPRSRLAISLPAYHAICSAEEVQVLISPTQRTVASVDEYTQACREVFEIQRDFGAICFKDQSAYTRAINYGNPSKSQAEDSFNWIMADPRRKLSYPDGNRPLGDYLFHEYVRMAEEMNLPVQLHTGHMAGTWNDVGKARAIHLVPVLEMHKEVSFDLFHLNWPYDGDILFLGKNYPNVAIDFCWTHIIDPVYAQRMIPQILGAVPHSKIHGYGSDHSGNLERSWAHSQIARDNIAIGLAEMVSMEYIGLDDAKEISRAWLFDNPNHFFRLGF
jgi:predicted TIM-barrel fold metal-dependent hydrolase